MKAMIVTCINIHNGSKTRELFVGNDSEIDSIAYSYRHPSIEYNWRYVVRVINIDDFNVRYSESLAICDKFPVPVVDTFSLPDETANK